MVLKLGRKEISYISQKCFLLDFVRLIFEIQEIILKYGTFLRMRNNILFILVLHTMQSF